MPTEITILLSKAHPVKDAVVSLVEGDVRDAAGKAGDYLMRAINVVGTENPMTDGQKSIWKGCFLADPTRKSTLKAFDVIFNTWKGITADHTIKLADSPYVTKFGEIHLNYNDFVVGNRPILQARVWRYIHEATHKFAGTRDIGVGIWTMLTDGASEKCYLNAGAALKESKIGYRLPGLGPDDALKNADSYAGFVVLLEQLRNGLFRPVAS
jgi:hypothetical protein